VRLINVKDVNKLLFFFFSVAFSARFADSHDSSAHGISLGSHQTLVFDDALTNVGSAYSTSTGIFTSPVAGTYAFFLTQMSPNAHGQIDLSIVRNGQVLDMVFLEGGRTDSDEQGSSLVTIHCAQGDQVWVRQEAGDAVRASYWTVFTGFLLHADI
jgi:hypothetical protein